LLLPSRNAFFSSGLIGAPPRTSTSRSLFVSSTSLFLVQIVDIFFAAFGEAFFLGGAQRLFLPFFSSSLSDQGVRFPFFHSHHCSHCFYTRICFPAVSRPRTASLPPAATRLITRCLSIFSSPAIFSSLFLRKHPYHLKNNLGPCRIVRAFSFSCSGLVSLFPLASAQVRCGANLWSASRSLDSPENSATSFSFIFGSRVWHAKMFSGLWLSLCRHGPTVPSGVSGDLLPLHSTLRPPFPRILTLRGPFSWSQPTCLFHHLFWLLFSSSEKPMRSFHPLSLSNATTLRCRLDLVPSLAICGALQPPQLPPPPPPPHFFSRTDPP